MIPHIETTIIYNYFVENWENAIVPTKNILRTISDDASDFFKKPKKNMLKFLFTFTQLRMNSFTVKEIQLPLSLFGHFSALFSLSEQLVFYTSVCIMT